MCLEDILRPRFIYFLNKWIRIEPYNITIFSNNEYMWDHDCQQWYSDSGTKATHHTTDEMKIIISNNYWYRIVVDFKMMNLIKTNTAEFKNIFENEKVLVDIFGVESDGNMFVIKNEDIHEDKCVMAIGFSLCAKLKLFNKLLPMVGG